MNIHDESQSGRPSTAVNDNVTFAVLHVVHQGRQFTLDKIKTILHKKYAIEVSCDMFTCILKEQGLTKIRARWVPKLLTLEMKEDCLTAAHKFLDDYTNDPTILN